ncbi:GIY-YIG nuclease family protein [Clostridium cylindrosporum]|uniref:GIY-YIG domain-containing protein n=1 Tax=Clostridium cylindrosporum DSM 605 TaxID=1121307 RepID=A0A0J8DEB6_CLOCY|nr:GIY-YIG nuclease family protein [Clostridium cylindrosporum]KMT22569.1 hypothetical protein CLCY_10c01170 [Clostridium cylindrosporum DSM 605]
MSKSNEISKERKKELQKEYKLTKPDMGIYIIRCEKLNKCYIDYDANLYGINNGILMRLQTGWHPNKILQKDFNELGVDEFKIEVLDKLEYSKDETKVDYSDDLRELRETWKEELIKEYGEVVILYPKK